MSNVVTLRNGTTALEPMVSITMMSLKTLISNDPIAFYELVEICKNKDHKLFGNIGEKLGSLGLLEPNGRPHSIVRTITLAATEGEGMDLKLVSPYAKQQEVRERATEKTCNINDKELYSLARKIANTVFEYAATEASSRDERPWMEDYRKESANPFYNQSNGFFLELYYGKPSYLWTPWGKWHFGGSGSGSWQSKNEGEKGPLDNILERLGATLHIAEKQTSMGCYGPVYALHKVDDIELPTPQELEKGAFDEYEVIEAAWEYLSA